MVDKSIFNKTLDILALRVKPAQVQDVLRKYKSQLWSFPRRKNVVDCPEEPQKFKLILFADEIPAELQSIGEKIFYQVHLCYDDYSFEEVLRRVIPEPIDAPTSFESIGHIAHFNLRDDVWPFRHIVGQVLLDKHPQYRTVVSKVGSLEGPFRTFKMEVLAGDDDLVATVKEGGLTLHVPFDKAYWNSRLSGERQRVLKIVKKGDRLVDMFCGVGAMSCLAARKNCLVFSNDLNPDATKAAELNAKLNGVSLAVSCGDAREFVKRLVAECVITDEVKTHFIMNLPEIAIDFLDVFRGILGNEKCAVDWFVYVHCFSRSGEDDVKERVEKSLGVSNGDLDLEIVEVRDVAPNKKMYCAQFRIPLAVLENPKKARV